MDTDAICQFTLWARGLLTQEASELLLQVYGLKPDGTFLAAKHLPALEANAEARETRRRLEKLLADEKDAGVAPEAAAAKLVKEVAFTHLNRLVALKMLEDPERRLIRRAALAGYPEPNGFKMYLPDHEEDYRLYQQGTAPPDELGESPRDRAYRHFLLWQYGELAKEVRVLFDPDNLASRLFPRPKVLRQVIERLNSEELKEAWKPGNEETIGWVYQFFKEPDLEIFRGKAAMQVPPHLVGARTQNFTPRWVVRFLVENSIGRLWLEMHPDSRLADRLGYLVPPFPHKRGLRLRRASEISLLDPAAGTMHFGLVAFELFAEMYREELENQGRQGWPAKASITSVDEIPAAILRNNLFGIDVDLRAVQLGALALYIRSKSLNPGASLPEPNLACADVTYLTPELLESYLEEAGLNRPVYTRILKAVFAHLQQSVQTGSLLRLEQDIQSLIEKERQAAMKDLTLFPDVDRFGDALVGGPRFWELLANQIRKAMDDITTRYGREGRSTFYADQAARGFKLLEFLMRRYDVVATNPPYLDSRDYNPALKKFLNTNYRDANRNLYAAMIQRSLELLEPGGRLAMLAGQSFMFISSFERLREHLLGNVAIETLVQFDYGLFKARVDTAAFVLRREPEETGRGNSVGVYFRLVKAPDAEAKRRAFEEALERRRRGESDPRVYEYRQGDFAAIPGSPWVYWITPGLRRLFLNNQKLGELAAGIHGTATYDNFRFLRYWWEVKGSSVRRDFSSWDQYQREPADYVPYMKGGSFRRWYGNQEYLLQLLSGGRALEAFLESKRDKIRGIDVIFRRGVTWTDLTAGRFSARLSPGGFIFDVSGSSAFPPDVELVLGIMNSTLAQYALKILNPTVHVQVGDLARLPVPRRSSDLLRNLVNEAVKLARTDSEEDEITYDFIAPPAWPSGAEAAAERHRRLAEIEREIDEEVYRLYEICDEDRRAIEAELAAPTAAADENDDGDNGDGEAEADEGVPLTQEELAQRWIGYAVGIALGRFQPGVAGALGCGRFSSEIAARLRGFTDTDGLMVLEEGHPDDLARRVLDILRTIYGDEEAERVVRTATGSAAPLREAVESYLLGPFWRDHVKRYRKRPIYWLIQSPKKSYSLYLFHERATPDTLPTIRGNRYLGGRLNRLRQEQSALAETIARGNLGARRRAGLIAEEIEELEEFDRRLEAVTRVPAADKHGRPVTVRWEPELDDGVLINAAPLHELLPSWREVNPKKVWEELEGGAYDWSKTAMRYWPQRVLAKCKENKSFAIAHGLA